MGGGLAIPDPPVGTPSSLRRWAYLTLGILLVALMASAYWMTSPPRPEEVSQEALMTAGLDALYTRNDAETAATRFRKVLDLNPSHYGATFQLAMALDRSGKSAEARPFWEKALKMAEAYNDKATVDAVRARLPKPEPPTEGQKQAALMTAGLDALYGSKDPRSAATHFRKVLQLNPSHYGATFQLATALDRGGKPTEARPFWEKALKMAVAYNDKPTIDAARARLARMP